jgi:ferric-dicitrate binding protein FerR (iron transport regulator)
VTTERPAGDDLEGLYDLVSEVIDGTASAARKAELEEWLRGDADARRAYLHYALLHAELRLTAGVLKATGCPPPTVDGGTREEDAGAAERSRARLKGRKVAGQSLPEEAWAGAAWTRKPDVSGKTLARLAVAACVVALIGAGVIGWRGGSVGPGRVAGGWRAAARPDRGNGVGLATVTEARNVIWARGQRPLGLNGRIEPGELRCLAGRLRLAFDSGAVVTLEGPADLKVESGMRIRALRGRITAVVEDRAKGFTIETPSAVVVDQGTEFGVEVDATGQTGVVVFKGLVDLAQSAPASADRATPVKRLRQGEGLRVGRAGGLSRIFSVDRRSIDDDWSIGPARDGDALIRSVRDNIRDLGSANYYQVVHRGLADGKLAYVDRLYQWKGVGPEGLPDFLRAADYIMPFNGDKFTRSLQINVEVARPATLYLFYDDRQQVPAWLAAGFTDTGVDILLDVAVAPTWKKKRRDFPFSVWKRDVEPGEPIMLGSIDVGVIEAMYGIAAAERR